MRKDCLDLVRAQTHGILVDAKKPRVLRPYQNLTSALFVAVTCEH